MFGKTLLGLACLDHCLHRQSAPGESRRSFVRTKISGVWRCIGCAGGVLVLGDTSLIFLTRFRLLALIHLLAAIPRARTVARLTKFPLRKAILYLAPFSGIRYMLPFLLPAH